MRDRVTGQLKAFFFVKRGWSRPWLAIMLGIYNIARHHHRLKTPKIRRFKSFFFYWTAKLQHWLQHCWIELCFSLFVGFPRTTVAKPVNFQRQSVQFYYTNVTTSSRYIHFINTSLVLLVHRRHLHHLLLFNSSSTIMVEYSKIVVGSHSASSSTSTLSRMLDASHLHSPSMVGFCVEAPHLSFIILAFINGKFNLNWQNLSWIAFYSPIILHSVHFYSVSY